MSVAGWLWWASRPATCDLRLQGAQPDVEISLWPGIEPLAPVECVVAERAAMRAQGSDGMAVHAKTREDHERMPVTGLRVVRLSELVPGKLHRRTKRLGAQQGKGWALNGIGGKVLHAHNQVEGLMRFHASRAACLARAQVRLDAPRLALQSLDISDSTSSKSRPGYWPRAVTPKP